MRMFSNLIYYLPLGSLLSKITLEEDVTLNGDLQYALSSLLEKYLSKNELTLVFNKNLKAKINTKYPAQTNLWTIFHGIICRYHLLSEIKVSGINKNSLTVKLLEGPAWKK